MLLDAYVQIARPSYVGGLKPWLFVWKYQKLYGLPMPVPGGMAKPRIVRALHMRALGVLFALSVQHDTDRRLPQPANATQPPAAPVPKAP